MLTLAGGVAVYAAAPASSIPTVVYRKDHPICAVLTWDAIDQKPLPAQLSGPSTVQTACASTVITLRSSCRCAPESLFNRPTSTPTAFTPDLGACRAVTSGLGPREDIAETHRRVAARLKTPPAPAEGPPQLLITTAELQPGELLLAARMGAETLDPKFITDSLVLARVRELVPGEKVRVGR